ncbi:MAG: zf-HC2 domain-containing protein [Candidatus Aminicenantes bacterium]|nr:zf-HC2 domain-containing protein [Candidatus Aminicenantes bacterium]
MKKCKYENLIDAYLLNRLSDEERQEFEAHYFDCPACFARMGERDSLIAAIKYKGHEIFKEFETQERQSVPFLEKLTAFLTPKQWAMATATAAVFLIIALGVIPNLKTSQPEFFINDDLVRGSSIKLISPVIAMDSVPSQFQWESLGEDVEYKIEIFNHVLMWSATTMNNYISLPEEVKDRMVAGEKYSWQVKAFSKEGSLIAVSSRVQFPFDR